MGDTPVYNAGERDSRLDKHTRSRVEPLVKREVVSSRTHIDRSARSKGNHYLNTSVGSKGGDVRRTPAYCVSSLSRRAHGGISRESNTIDSSLSQDFPYAGLNSRVHQICSTCGERKTTHALYRASTGICSVPCASRNRMKETMGAWVEVVV